MVDYFWVRLGRRSFSNEENNTAKRSANTEELKELRNSIVTACLNLEQLRVICDPINAMVSRARQFIRARAQAIPNE